MKKITGISEKRKWIVLLTSVFLIAFIAAYSFVQKDKSYAASAASYVIRDMDNNDIEDSSYKLRRSSDTFRVVGLNGATDAEYVTWTINNKDVLSFNKDSELIEGGHLLSQDVFIRNVGRTSLLVSIYDKEGGELLGQKDITLDISYTINEYVEKSNGAPNGKDGVTMTKIFDTDDRRALVMDKPGSWIEFGTSALDQPTFLNLNLGSAKQPEDDPTINITWTSSNRDVIDVNMEANRVVAVAAGSAKLSVIYHKENEVYTDEILVYVRPEIIHDGVSYNSDNSGIGSGATVTNGDLLEVSVEFDHNPLESIYDKIDWVIAKEDAGVGTVLVRDSKDNGDFKDEANLIWIPSSNSYQLRARAGTYTVQFYVHGTYAGFEEAKAKTPGCAPVSISSGVMVPSNFRNKTIILSVGAQFRLPEGFNIADSAFDAFTVTSDIASDTAPPSAINAYNCVTYDTNTYTITAQKAGIDTIKVHATEKCKELNIPDITAGDEITLTINISHTLALNVSEMTMSVGETVYLYGIAPEMVLLPEECEWSSSDRDGSFIKIQTNGFDDTNGTQATITATGATPVNSPVFVTLKWTSPDGITFAASCRIRVAATVTDFHIEPAALTMNVGETQTITTDLKSAYRLTWLSSDTSVATIVDSSGATPSAQVTAKKPGTIVITAINVANSAYSTCLLTVVQPVTSLEIGIAGKSIGKTYETELSQEFVFMEALYEPNDATEKDFEWASDDETVATVDETGKVTLLKEGVTNISCKAKNVTAYCQLVITTSGDTEDSNITVDNENKDDNECEAGLDTSNTSVLAKIKEVLVNTFSKIKEVEKALEAGGEIKVSLGVTKIEKIPSEDKAAMDKSSELNSLKIGPALDITLIAKCFAKNNNTPIDETKVTNLDEDKSVTINLEFTRVEELFKNSHEDYKSYKDVQKGYKRNYYMIRIHDGKPTRLDCTLSKDGKTISFKSHLFSTYVLAYEDVSETNEPDVSSTPSVSPATSTSPAPSASSVSGVLLNSGGSNISYVSATPAPSAQPSGTPAVTATPVPSTQPSSTPVVTATPTPVPSVAPVSTNIPTTTPSAVPTKTVKVGDKVTASSLSYKVTSVKDTKTVAFIEAKKDAKTVVIPATIKINGKTYKVTSVADNALKGNKKVTKVTIGANITKIGKSAFKNCNNLKSIIVKTKKLKARNVGSKAFEGINSKAKIKVPKGKVKAYKKLVRAKAAGENVKVNK